jgi:hypothetical protein
VDQVGSVGRRDPGDVDRLPRKGTELELGDVSDEPGVNDRDQFLRNRIERGCLGHPASRVR